MACPPMYVMTSNRMNRPIMRKQYRTKLGTMIFSAFFFSLYGVSVIQRYQPTDTLESNKLFSSLLDNFPLDVINNPRPWSNKSPVVLFWTEFFSQPFSGNAEHYLNAVQLLSACPEVHCELTADRSRLNDSAAVLFHIRDLNNEDGGLGYEYPTYRSVEQDYVFYLLESPVHTQYDLSVFDWGFFNLTFTYRLDSDIFHSFYFQNYHPVIWTREEDFLALWRNKTNGVAYYESNCNAPSGRRVVVDKLQQYMQVDVYGKCGFLTCPKEEEERCNALLGTYKFYLAFENSLCKDYVTEKIHRAFNYGAIPVVFGNAAYRDIFPPNSFINSLDFPSISALADYMFRVANDRQLNFSYFKWRYDAKWMQFPSKFKPARSSWCSLCRRLHKKNKPTKIMSNISKWWMDEARCYVVDVEWWDRSPGQPRMGSNQFDVSVFS